MPETVTTAAVDEAFLKVSALVADFKAHESHYLSPGYQEAEVRKDFVESC